MPIYLVEKDNGEDYPEDYYSWVDCAFKSFRRASEYLMADGYTMYFSISIKGEVELEFYSETGNARIIETILDIF